MNKWYMHNSEPVLDKKLWNMKLMVIPIVIGALKTIPKSLVKRLEDLEIRQQMETIQTVKACKLPPLILLRKVVVFLGSEVNRWPYWFMWECEKDGCKKASLYTECYSLSSLYSTLIIALLRAARILKRLLEIWGNFLSLPLQWKIISLCWCKKTHIMIIIILSKWLNNSDWSINPNNTSNSTDLNEHQSNGNELHIP